MRQNAPRDAQLADKKIAYAILLARQSPAALTGRMRGMGESMSACGLCSSAFLRILLVIALGIFYKRINGYNVDIKLRE
uniref:Uncharacterized protein n=1 Tax=Eubacterium cellulosolvens (strain ATCC 43171 / JCM 9499 / 6) TaxID=633697 RepID=I5AQ72_EUBC6